MEIPVKYVARLGARISDKDAAVVGPEIDRISRTNGGDALAVVEAARNEASPLHPYIEWENEIAAEQWRLHEARILMDSVHLVVKEADDGPRETVRAFHLISTKEDPEAKIERRYYPLDMVVENREWSEQVVQRARAELRSFRVKYSRYQEYIQKDKALAGAFDAIHKLEEED